MGAYAFECLYEYMAKRLVVYYWEPESVPWDQLTVNESGEITISGFYDG